MISSKLKKLKVYIEKDFQAIFLIYKGGQVTKPIIVVKIPYELLCIIQVKGFLIKCFNFLTLLDIYQSFWSLITIVASDWPHTFLQPDDLI